MNSTLSLFLSVIFLAVVGAHVHAAPKDISVKQQSSYELLAAENKAMQDDPSLNPAMFWVDDGENLWQQKLGSQNKSCSSCHGDAKKSMRGVATQFPKVLRGKLQTLEGQINQCRIGAQGASPLTYESKDLLALTAFVAFQSKGMPISIHETSVNAPFLKKGRQTFNERMGQLNLSCAQCHEDRVGLKLGGSLIPQGHPNATPFTVWNGKPWVLCSADFVTA